MQKVKIAIISSILAIVILASAITIQKSNKDKSHCLNMGQVVKIESTTNGSLITLENGEGYYWEER